MSDISTTLRTQIDTAFVASQKKRASKYKCPSCEKYAALLTLSGEGMLIGRLCRFCAYHTFANKDPLHVPKKPKRLKKEK